MKIAKYIFLLLYLFSFGYHCFSSLQSGEESSNLSMKVTEVVVEVEEKVFHIEVTDIDRVHNNVRKIIGHFAYFGLIAVFGYLCIYFFTLKTTKTLLITLAIGLVMALISEVLQNFADGRGPSVKDILIDYSGYTLSSLIMFLIIFLVIRKRNNNNKELIGVE